MANGQEPVIIQGGMGVGVSAWHLARAVAMTGQLGVVSGTGVDIVLARRLQLGDPGGHLRRAMAEFPIPDMAARVLDRYFVDGGKAADTPFKGCALPKADCPVERLELLVMSNFVEVTLAKEGHDGIVGINYLEKIQLPTLPSLFGAMLAGVDYVVMGAGIPRAIPGILDQLAQGEAVELPLVVQDAARTDRYVTRFDPVAFTDDRVPWLARPKFLAIIASATLATVLARKASGHVDGFVIEGPTAGGHNAPPRGALKLNERGEPIYGERDAVDLEAIKALGRPFWLAGSYGTPQRVVEALDRGATGIQVGTAFAFCRQSELTDDIRQAAIQKSIRGEIDVRTDPVASPTGFPFKVLELTDTLSDKDVYESRRRVCDIGYLRHAYKRRDGSLGWRCGAEPVDAYLAKGGKPAETRGRKCVCNALMANIGIGQYRSGEGCEKTLVTSGDEARHIHKFLPSTGGTSYSAEDVVAQLLSAVETGVAITP